MPAPQLPSCEPAARLDGKQNRPLKQASQLPQWSGRGALSPWSRIGPGSPSSVRETTRPESSTAPLSPEGGGGLGGGGEGEVVGEIVGEVEGGRHGNFALDISSDPFAINGIVPSVVQIMPSEPHNWNLIRSSASSQWP